MSISPISAPVYQAPPAQVQNTPKPVAQNNPPAPVASDSDGDSDGSGVNVKA